MHADVTPSNSLQGQKPTNDPNSPFTTTKLIPKVISQDAKTAGRVQRVKLNGHGIAILEGW